MKKVVIVAAKRTAVGNFNGTLAHVSAVKLGSVVIQSLLTESRIDPQLINEVIMGQVLTAGMGQNPARQAAIGADLAKEIPATTINQVCGSGLKAVHLAVQAILSGDADIVIAGGQENMSQSPHLLMGARDGFKMGNTNLIDSMIYDGLTDVYHQYHMGITAENIAAKFGVSRQQQDQFALNSQLKATKAMNAGLFTNEITAVMVPQKKGDPLSFIKDEFIKPNSTIEALEKLRAAFKKDGTVTAGNSSGANDGAAAVMLMSEEKALILGLEPMAYIKAYASTGLEPELMGLGPIFATRKTLALANWQIEQLDLIEANEAFAAQAYVVNQQLALDPDKVNVNGGAIAIGHPIGASGCRILVTLVHEMQRRDAKRALATLCIGGGMGIALALERK